jgi:hypothetical protein
VEGLHPHAAPATHHGVAGLVAADADEPLADEAADPLLHLLRGLVREGDREDLVGVDAALLDEVGDPVGEHAGLARSGAGHDEERPSVVEDRGALLGVHAGEQGVLVDAGVDRAGGLGHSGARLKGAYRD